MTKARDISSLIGSSGQIDNTKITLDVNEIPSLTTDKIPNLDAGKITSGSLGVDRIPALDAGKITTGTFADARISNSSVSQHATSFDDNKIVNDISTLALRQASNENKGAYNTNSMYVDVFQDATGFTNGANTSRDALEFISSTVDSTPASVKVLIQANDSACKEQINDITPTLTTASQNTSTKKYGTGSLYFPSAGSKARYGTISAGNIATDQDFSIDCWVYHSDTYSTEGPIFDIGGYYTGGINGAMMCRVDEHGQSKISIQLTDGNTTAQYGLIGNANDIPDNQWFHLAITRQSNTWRVFVDGTQKSLTASGSNPGNEITMGSGYGLDLGWLTQQNQSFDGYIDNFRVSVGTNLFGTSNFTPYSTEINYSTTSATGNFTCPTITSSSSVSKMGAIITYQDYAGTNTLNTDIVLQLSADNGSNFTTATLTALPDFATGIKMAKVNDLAVTAGTQLKYKINFANQASGSKEARIRGVALQY